MNIDREEIVGRYMEIISYLNILVEPILIPMCISILCIWHVSYLVV